MTQLEDALPASAVRDPLDGERLQRARLVVSHLLQRGSATRADLAQATGIGRSGIAATTALLVEAGVLDRAPDAGGRSPALELTARRHVLVTAGFDLDDAVATVATLSGDEQARFVEPLIDARADAPAPIDVLATVLARALAHADRSGTPAADVTVIVDGSVASRPPLVFGSARLGAEPVDLAAELAARVPAMADLAEVALVPAISAAAIAELAEHGDRSMLVVDADDGVRAAALVGGRVLQGAHGFGVGFGHLPVVPNGARCACGQRGCLDTVASAAHVLEHAGLGDLDRASGRIAALDELARRIEAADDRARWAWLDAAHWIGRSLQLAVSVLDPGEIVVRGYAARFVDDLGASYRDNRPTIGGGILTDLPRLVVAEAGPDAPWTGARLLARERLLADPLRLVG